MQRIVQGLSATLSHTFYVDGVATNPSPDAATVTITRDDGTPVVTAAAATEAGTGVVTFTLTPAQTATLDVLAVAWTASFGGQSQTFTGIVEVAGGVLFTNAQARALSALSSAVTYPTSRIVEARTMVESALEDLCSVAFVPRYRRETVSGTGTTLLALSMPRVTAIRAVKRDGVSIGASELAALAPAGPGVVHNPSRWSAGFANYEVTYEHGHASPPPRVSQAALLWAKNHLVQGPIDDRTTSMSSEDGTFLLATPGMRGSWTGIPEVDATINQYNVSVQVA